jgi:hypothetical protein
MKNFIFLFLFLSTACSTSVRTLGTRMLSPESNGSKGVLGGGSVEARLMGNSHTRLNFENDQLNNHVERREPVSALGVAGDLGIVEKLDLFLILPFNDAITLYGLKYQLLGETRKEAKKGNFSLALEVGHGNGGRSSDESYDFNADNVKKFTVDKTHTEAGLILGYRWTDQILNYLNGIYFHENMDGKVTTDSGSLTDAHFKYSQYGMLYSYGLIIYQKSMQVKLDYSYMTSQWSKTGTVTASTLSGGIGFNW